MYLLDEKNTVTSVVQTSVTSKEDCLSRIVTFEKMKKTSSRFYVAVFGNINEPRVEQRDKPHWFKQKEYFENNRNWKFAFLKSESGECFSANHGKGNPCPFVDEFPIKNQPF